MKNLMMTLAFCLCTATLFAQQNAGLTYSTSTFNGQPALYNKERQDDNGRKSAGQIMDSIRNSPVWKAEFEAIKDEFYNSAAWKKNKDDAAKALPLWDEHSTTGNKAWQDAVGKANAEMENSEAYKTYHAKVKDFNRRMEQETMKLLYKNDPRYKTAF